MGIFLSKLRIVTHSIWLAVALMVNGCDDQEASSKNIRLSSDKQVHESDGTIHDLTSSVFALEDYEGKRVKVSGVFLDDSWKGGPYILTDGRYYRCGTHDKNLYALVKQKVMVIATVKQFVVSYDLSKEYPAVQGFSTPGSYSYLAVESFELLDEGKQ